MSHLFEALADEDIFIGFGVSKIAGGVSNGELTDDIIKLAKCACEAD